MGGDYACWCWYGMVLEHMRCDTLFDRHDCHFFSPYTEQNTQHKKRGEEWRRRKREHASNKTLGMAINCATETQHPFRLCGGVCASRTDDAHKPFWIEGKPIKHFEYIIVIYLIFYGVLCLRSVCVFLTHFLTLTHRNEFSHLEFYVCVWLCFEWKWEILCVGRFSPSFPKRIWVKELFGFELLAAINKFYVREKMMMENIFFPLLFEHAVKVMAEILFMCWFSILFSLRKRIFRLFELVFSLVCWFFRNKFAQFLGWFSNRFV